ncbi:MAG TPA: DNA-3-methyladenine glycosylase [Candidatus Dojkabacteria bacterium]|nr:DNA-3-methyladenine glycosylase [Candidatus Dojkabacteria bacterium]
MNKEFLAQLKDDGYVPVDRLFFKRDSIAVSKELLGCILVSEKDNILTGGKIVETEAYPNTDAGSHVYKRNVTERTKYQLLDGGHLYLYLIYGMYIMTSIVTNDKGIPDVSFIRSMEPIYGKDVMFKRRGINNEKNLSNGPGRLSECLGISIKDQGKDLVSTDSDIYILKPIIPQEIVISSGKRINLGMHGKEKKDALNAINVNWRFYIEGSKFLSK